MLLKLLGISAYRYTRDSVVWGFVDGGGDVVSVEVSGEEWVQVLSTKLPRVLAIVLAEPLRVLVFVAVGASGILVNLAVATAVYNSIKHYGLVANPLASAIGFEASVLWNFTLHEKVTFKDRSLDRSARGVISRLLKYHIASIASLATQVLFATLIPVALGVEFWIGQLAGILVGFAVNYLLGYVYTWSTQLIRGADYGAQAQEVRIRAEK